MNYLGISDNAWIILIVLTCVIFYKIKKFQHNRKTQKNLKTAQRHKTVFDNVSMRLDNGTATPSDEEQFKKSAIVIAIASSSILFKLLVQTAPDASKDTKEYREMIRVTSDLLATWILFQDPKEDREGKTIQDVLKELDEEGLKVSEFSTLMLGSEWDKLNELLNTTYLHGKWNTRISELVSEIAAN